MCSLYALYLTIVSVGLAFYAVQLLLKWQCNFWEAAAKCIQPHHAWHDLTVNQSIYIFCLHDSSGESTNNNSKRCMLTSHTLSTMSKLVQRLKAFDIRALKHNPGLRVTATCLYLKQHISHLHTLFAAQGHSYCTANCTAVPKPSLNYPQQQQHFLAART